MQRLSGQTTKLAKQLGKAKGTRACHSERRKVLKPVIPSVARNLSVGSNLAQNNLRNEF